MTKAELLEQINETCPHCKAGTPLRKRHDSGEWVHDHLRTDPVLRSTGVSHAFCLAHDLREQHQDILNG